MRYTPNSCALLRCREAWLEEVYHQGMAFESLYPHPSSSSASCVWLRCDQPVNQLPVRVTCRHHFLATLDSCSGTINPNKLFLAQDTLTRTFYHSNIKITHMATVVVRDEIMRKVYSCNMLGHDRNFALHPCRYLLLN